MATARTSCSTKPARPSPCPAAACPKMAPAKKSFSASARSIWDAPRLRRQRRDALASRRWSNSCNRPDRGATPHSNWAGNRSWPNCRPMTSAIRASAFRSTSIYAARSCSTQRLERRCEGGVMTSDRAHIEPSRAIKLCGTEAPVAPSRRLVAGPLSVEIENGQLRYVTFAGVEVLRGVAFLVRDDNWGTYSPKIDGLAIEEGVEGFVVAYRAACADARQKLVYEAHISGRADGSLSFEAVATPETDVVTNRTGFVVLYPAALAGQPVRVTHVDGGEIEARFPSRISPSQPIFNIRSLSHEVAPGLRATCRMEGDAFEMEDQRNWGDASYKTYVRPLALPWGYTLAKGSRHEQSVRLSFSGKVGGGAVREMHRDLTVALGADLATRMPEVG